MSTHSLLAEDLDGHGTEIGGFGSFGRRSSKAKILKIPARDNESTVVKTSHLGTGSTTIRSYTLKCAYLGFAFCLIFTAFNVAQAYITVLYPDIGTFTLGIIYGFFALGSLIAPRVGETVGAKWAMCAASVFFVLFIGVLNTGMQGLVLLSAVFVGLGSGILWINQGVWLSRLGSNTGGALTGYFTGVFFTIMNSNGIVGNLLAIILLEAGLGINLMIWGMFAAGAIGSAMMLFTDPMHSTVVSTLPEKTVTFVDQLRAVWDVSKMKKSLVILPSIWMQGCNLAFMFGRLPEMLPAGAGKVAVAQVFLCYGTTQCIFSYANGIIYDKFGWKPLVHSFLGTGLLGYFILITLVPSSYSLSARAGDLIEPYLLIGGLLGHLDTSLNTVINLAMSKAYHPGSETAAAFGFYRVGFCAAMTIMNILASGFRVGFVVLWNAAWIVVAEVLYRRYASELQGVGSVSVPATADGVDAELGAAGRAQAASPTTAEREALWKPAEGGRNEGNFQ
ncbi:hypothetical protein DFJ77DRAFT_473639 [Powellomyces hirtus]|nr:hypothetical protein DFJ77DRAFT_473639 [Powellomyces hirtus]